MISGSPALRQIALVNPNTNHDTTGRMVAVAQRAAGERFRFTGITAEFGAAMITDEAELQLANRAVAALAQAISARADLAGVIVSAFADPGLDELRASLSVPVVGIAEAGMRAAAEGRRSFAVATTTRGLVQAIDRRAAELGLADLYRGVVLTVGEAHALLPDPAGLAAALSETLRRAVDELGAEAVVIGGGPLAEAAELLADETGLAIIRPIPEAVRLIARRLNGRSLGGAGGLASVTG